LATPAIEVPVLTGEELLAILWRRRLVALTTAAVVSGVVLAVLMRVTPLYEAQASLDLNLGRKAVQFGGETGLDQPAQQFSQLNTQRDLMLSNTVLERTVKLSGLGTTRAYGDAAMPAQVLRERVKVVTNRDSFAMVVSLRDEDPQRAEQALQVLLDAYLAYQSQRMQERAERSLAFLTEEVDKAKSQLDRLVDESRAFADDRTLIASDPDANFIAYRLSGFSEQRVALTRDAATLDPVLARIHEARLLADPDLRRATLLGLEPISHPLLVSRQKQEIFDLETKRAQLAQKYIEKHTRMIEVNETIAAKRLQLDEAIALTADGIIANRRRMAEQLTELEARIAAEERALATYRADLATHKRLEDEVEAQRKLHRGLVERLGQERITAQLDQPTVTISDRPSAASSPANVKPLLFISIAFALGGVAGLALPIALELADRRLRDGREAARTAGVPLLAVLPRVPGGPTAIPALDEPLALSEAVRALRVRLRLQQRGRDSHNGRGWILVIASAQSGDGRTLLATRLAAAFAASGTATLLVDGDLRRPVVHDQLGLRDARGFSHLLAGEPEIVPQAGGQPHLDVLGAGLVPPNPSELLNSHCLGEWFAHCRSRYELIVVDTPPLGEVADALLVGAEADAVLLIARAEHTQRTTLAAAADQCGAILPKVLGLVWNDQHSASPVPTAQAGSGT